MPTFARIVLSVFALLWVTAANAATRQAGALVETNFICQKDAAEQVAEASKRSAFEAGLTVQLAVREGACLELPAPIPFTLVRVHMEWTDIDGDAMELWEMQSSISKTPVFLWLRAVTSSGI